MDLIKGLFRRDSHRRRLNHRSPIQSPTQRRCSEALVAFTRVLSDQQLITGFAILIAAISSRCQISLYEWHVVTSLAYFSATTHSLSLDVLRGYLEKHVWVRYSRILFTVVFLVFFSFVFVVDYSVSRAGGKMTWPTRHTNSGTIVQCLFLRVGSPIDAEFRMKLILIVVPILAILWGKHISVIGRLRGMSAVQATATTERHITVTVLDRISLHLWSNISGIPQNDCEEILNASHTYYDAKIRPSEEKKRISTWYFLEQYHGTYLSEIPVWAFQFVYGTSNTIQAVWYSDVQVTDEFKILGFGQVVAIGLLVLLLLAFVDIVPGKRCGNTLIWTATNTVKSSN
jgi:hypothetical protein